MIRVRFYTRKECQLCERARENLRELEAEIPHRVVEVDIETDPALSTRYADQIPILEIGPYTLRAPIDKTALRITLSAARDSQYQREPVSGASRNRAVRLHKAVFFFTKHWLAIFNLCVFLYVGLPFCAPVLMKASATMPARIIYRGYSLLCHQLAYRSWFLFGDQAYYPRELAGLAVTSYEEATGMDPDDYWAARGYIGNDQTGYKVALCQRDVAIYGGILGAGLIFGLIRGKLKPISILLWIVIGILPMAIDGGSQFLSLIPGGPFPPRETTPHLRTLTGALFGVMNVWLAYPYVEESMDETRVLVAARLAGVRWEEGREVER